MPTVKLMRSKLHRCKVSECNINYVGSLSIDVEWMRQSGILPLEEVHVCNITNANRFSTYAIPAPEGSRIIGPNGACARLCDLDDQLIVFVYDHTSRKELAESGHCAKVLVFDDDGGLAQVQEQRISGSGSGVELDTKIVFESE